MTSQSSLKEPAGRRHRPLVLASASPRRAWLLQQAGVRVEIVPPPPEAEEQVVPGGSPPEVALAAARAKGLAAARLRPDALVLAADTVVALGEQVLGKPADEAEARAMLRHLAGREHWVYTAVVWAASVHAEPRVLVQDVTSSQVVFRQLTDEEIEAYVATGEPADKAGAYGIQGPAASFVAQLRGPWDNVVGLPVARALGLLEQARQELARLEEDG
ncbi:MAG: Maf family protein [Armatimonadetes bacterium]|nr:Maf family protein [Armatimonadota bacterium]